MKSSRENVKDVIDQKISALESMKVSLAIITTFEGKQIDDGTKNAIKSAYQACHDALGKNDPIVSLCAKVLMENNAPKNTITRKEAEGLLLTCITVITQLDAQRNEPAKPVGPSKSTSDQTHSKTAKRPEKSASDKPSLGGLFKRGDRKPAQAVDEKPEHIRELETKAEGLQKEIAMLRKQIDNTKIPPAIRKDSQQILGKLIQQHTDIKKEILHAQYEDQQKATNQSLKK